MSAIRNNILLVNPPLSLYQRYDSLWMAGAKEPPLGLCYLASILRKQGYPVNILDAQAMDLDIYKTVKLIKNYNPRYVGISISTIVLENASILAELLKKINPQIKIIVGGYHITALPIESLRDNINFDIGVVGEGERTIKDLILALDNNKDISGIKGLVFRDKENRIVFTGRPQRITNLDELPYPAFDLLPNINKFYRLTIQSLNGRFSFSLVTSRGCNGKCLFCDQSAFLDGITMHSAEYIVELLNILYKKYKIDNILFEDDNFFISKKRLIKIVDLIHKNKLKIRWSAMARIDSIDREMLKIAKEGNCWQICYGIESGSQRIIDFYKKGITIGQIIDTINLTKKIGIKVKCFFMLANPLETEESIKETVNLIKNINIDDISITFFTPYPGAKIWPDIEHYGKFYKKWDKMSCFHPIFIPYGFKYNELLKIRKKVLRDFYFRFKIILSYLNRKFSFSYLRYLLISIYCFSIHIFKKNEVSYCEC